MSVTISGLPAATSLTGAEQVPVVQSSTTKRTTVQDIATLGAGLPPQTGHAGEFLTTDGTSASWGTPAGGGGALSVLTQDVTPTVVDAATGGDIFAYTIPGGVIGAAGTLHIRTVWTWDCPTGGGDTEALNPDINFGGALNYSIVLGAPLSSSNGYTYLDIYITNLNDEAAQVIYGQTNDARYESSGPGSPLSRPLFRTSGFQWLATEDTSADTDLIIYLNPFGPGSVTTTYTHVVTTVTLLTVAAP